MSTTVIEALENAKMNFETIGTMSGLSGHPIYMMALEQLKNGVESLENGLSPDDVIQENMMAPVDTGD